MQLNSGCILVDLLRNSDGRRLREELFTLGHVRSSTVDCWICWYMMVYQGRDPSWTYKSFESHQPVLGVWSHQIR